MHFKCAVEFTPIHASNCQYPWVDAGGILRGYEHSIRLFIVDISMRSVRIDYS